MMKLLFNYCITLVISLSLNGCFLGKIPTVNFYENVPSRLIKRADQASVIPTDYQKLGELKINPKRKNKNLKAFLETSNTNAFLVIKKNKLIYEWYANDSIKNKPLTSFSIAKSMLSALVGIAIEEGKLNSVEDKVYNYVKNIDTSAFNQLKIRHLLQMTSGIRYSELDVFNTTNASKIFEADVLQFNPGQKHEYWSATYQLLGLVLQDAIAPQSISSYLSEKIWQPMGAEGNASWSVDNENGIEKTFCCIQAEAMDYARFGLIYLNNGFYNNRQIVPQSWVEKSIAINEQEGSAKKYNYGWWLPFGNTNEFLAKGFRGQRIFINKNKETVMVRLGENRAGLFGYKWSIFFRELNKML